MKRLNVFNSLAVLFVFSLMVWVFIPSEAEGDIPHLINLQGILRDGSGNPVPNGAYTVTFRIYGVPSGGGVHWTETQSVTTSNGLFNTQLGALTPIPEEVFNDSTRFLGITVSPDPEMTPRQQLTSASYAFAIPGYQVSGDNVILVKGIVALAPSGDSLARVMRLGGSVGIGTDAPTEKLDVNGSVRVSDTLFASNVSSNSPLNLQAPAGTTRMFIDDITGNVGIGTTTPSKPLHLSNPFAEFRLTDSDNGVEGQFAAYGAGIVDLSSVTNHPLTLSTNLTERMRITTAGNVGIGTTTPVNKLDIEGGAVIGATYSGSSTAPANGLLVESQIGVGTTSPFNFAPDRSVVHVAGALTPAFVLEETSIPRKWVIFPSAADGGLLIRDETAGGLYRLFISPSGNVGIGTVFPATKLQVVGDIRVGTTGTNGCIQRFDGVSIAGTCVSDARLKKNIEPFAPVLDKLARLQPVTFNWRREEYPELNLPKVGDQGLIAQEVEKVLPELVTEGENGFRAIEYHRLPLMTLQAVKELKAENDRLKTELQTLKALVEKLAAEKKEEDKKLGQLR